MSFTSNLKGIYEKEKKELQDELVKCGKEVSNPQECVDLALDYSLKLPSLWSSAGYTEQQRLQFLIFPEGLFYDRKKTSVEPTMRMVHFNILQN